MPPTGIPIHLDAPIHPTAPNPQTSSPSPPRSSAQPAASPAITTASVPTRTMPSADPTTAHPPPPQPGAHPVPRPTASATTSSPPLPPPPQSAPRPSPPSIVPAPPAPTAPPTTTAPPTHHHPGPALAALPSPAENLAATKSTVSSTPQPHHLPPATFEHPPGYQQAAPGWPPSHNPNAQGSAQEEDEGMLGTAMGWLNAAGRSLAEGERRVWDWVNGKPSR